MAGVATNGSVGAKPLQPAPGPAGSTQQTGYDTLGRMVTKTDELGRTTHYGYDALGRLTSVLDAKDGLTQYAYDEVGNRVVQTDANGHVTSFAYDSRGRETRRTLPDAAYETKGYDAAGRMTTRVDFMGRTTAYAYDVMNRLSSRTYPDSSSVGFTYTPTGRRETVTDARGTTSYEYDLRNRVSKATDPYGRVLEYGYNGAGARTSLTAKVAGEVLTTSYTYDVAERPDLVTDPSARVYDVDFDAVGRRTRIAYPNGTTTTYAYDLRNRVTNIQTLGVQSYAFTLDAAGNRTRIDELDGTARVYGYDELGRLTTETVTGSLSYAKTFGYDAVGNRMTQVTTGTGAGSQVYAYDTRDRLLTENGTVYGYDANGNLTSKSGEATYTWDFENRLVRVDLTNGTVVEHLYDADGNRVRTTVDGVPTNYLVDTCGGGSCNGSLSHVVAETNGLDSLTALYIRLGEELLAVMRPGGVTRYVHHDGIGSVRVLTDEAGATTDTRGYEGFGTVNTSAGSDPMPYGFAGEARDGASGLNFHRARWMDPRVGRFAGVDPKRGSPHVPFTQHGYLYASDSPVVRIDPTGQFDMASISVGLSISGLQLAEHAVWGAGTFLSRARVRDVRLWYNVLTATLHVEPDSGGLPGYTMAATSGLGPCMNASICEAVPNAGPIVSGYYTVFPSEIQSHSWFWQGDWGSFRVHLHPDAATLDRMDDFGRTDSFYLHGGAIPGTAGCVDVGGGTGGNPDTKRLVSDMKLDADDDVSFVVPKY